MAVTINWQTELMQAHAQIFDMSVDNPEHSSGYPRCEAGWRDILEQLCTSIEVSLGQNETFKLVRVGQKLGLLRIDWEDKASDETKARIRGAIQLAAIRACRTCEICGLERSAIHV